MCNINSEIINIVRSVLPIDMGMKIAQFVQTKMRNG